MILGRVKIHHDVMAIAVAKHGGVGPFAAPEGVVVGSSIQMVVALTPGKHVVPFAAVQMVILRMAVQVIVTFKTRNLIRVGRTVDSVVAHATRNFHQL
jgi:hypothetical protein